VSANLGATEAAEAAHALEHALRDADDGTVRLRLADLARALDAVAATARELAPPPAAEAAPDLPAMDEGATLHDSLARLLHLLENNNMRAIAAEGALRPALALDAGQPAAAALADAVATLRFDEAARLVADLMKRKGTP
jgi:hypothetical protein